MFVSKAAVVGGGTMGGEIAQAIAAADIPVVVKDIDQKFVDAALEKARAVTEGQLARLVKKEKLTQEQADARLAEVMGSITGTTTYEEFGDVDFVVEAVPEKMAIKQAVFAELDAATPGHAILASNTSSLSITEMGETTLRPDKVVGFHFFYPASVMPLVEVIVGDDTSPETATAAYNFAQAIKKQPIVCGEVPGFVVNNILMATIGEIWRAQEEHGLSLKAIDEAIAAAKVAPMGPFFLTDLLGLDTVLHVAEHLSESYGETFYVHKGLQQLVADGKLGAKSGGEGFFKDGEQTVPGDGEPDAEELVAMFTGRALIEACLLVEEGVCSVRDIDVGMMAGAGLDPRKGLLPPFWKADVEGLDAVLERIEQLQEKHGERFAPPVLLKRMVAQGRLGMKSGQGFYPYPQPDEGEQAETVKLETRGDVAIAWLANVPMNAVSPDVIRDLEDRLGEGQGIRRGRRDGDRLLDPAGLLGRRRHQGLHPDGRGRRRGADQHRPRAAARLRPGAAGDDRRRQRARLRRRLRAGDGLRRADRRRGGGLRPARDQAGDHPRLRRHPAAAAPGRSQQGAGDEPGRRRDPRRRGARVRPRQPGRPRPRAVRDGARLGAASWPARRRSRASRSSRSPTRATSTRGSRPRSRASPPPSAARTPRRASAPSSASGRRAGAAVGDASRGVGRSADAMPARRQALGRSPASRGRSSSRACAQARFAPRAAGFERLGPMTPGTSA